MTRIKLVLTMTLIAMALCACKRKVHNRTVHLTGSYSLTYYEFAPVDAFFVLYQNMTVVPPQVTEVAYNDQFIWGRVEPNGDKIFDPIPGGLFVIKVANGDLVAGLTPQAFGQEFPSLPLSQLAPSSSFWKPRWRVYQPKQH